MMHPDLPVRSALPHRPPMLMVDKILSIDGDGCVALKNISHSEPCFQGHFPEAPVFPGVLTLEALGQTCVVWMGQRPDGQLPLLAGIENARFLKMVVPGDRLELSVKLRQVTKGFHYFHTFASVDHAAVCEATMILKMR